MNFLGKLKLIWAKGLKKILRPASLNNCQIHKTAKVCPESELTGVSLGRYSYVGNRCFAVNAKIGSFCSVADNCRIGGASHPIEYVSSSPVFHRGKNILKKNYTSFDSPKTPQTVIENDVWLGAGCQIKSGVTIHTGAVIGMGSIVTHDVPPYEIWAGNPAKKLRDRFDRQTAERLLESKWWEYSEEKLQAAARHFDDPKSYLAQEKNI